MEEKSTQRKKRCFNNNYSYKYSFQLKIKKGEKYIQ